ncbi:group I truncated hemoglobin [Sphingomonas natans]
MQSIVIALLFLQAVPYAVPGEDAVDPYTPSAANAGASPFAGEGMAKAFHGQDGIRRIIDRTLTAAYADPVIGEIFEGHDKVRLSRTLFEQFCYLLDAGCAYSGRDMIAAHKDLGVQRGDMNRLVVLLQQAMRAERVPFQAQNRLLSKLAPMNHDVVQK